MKFKSRYVCSSCGGVSAKYQGKCYSCGEWGTLLEEAPPDSSLEKLVHQGGDIPKPKTLKEISTSRKQRYMTNISEFDRVLGGGVTDSSITLVGGEPGIGKSTLMLKITSAFKDDLVLYVSAEESLSQVRERAARMNIMSETLYLLAEVRVEFILEVARKLKPKIMIVDSIQTVYLSSMESAQGSTSQVREAASRFARNAKDYGVATFLVGHVTKDGSVAGPKTLEHLVDAVLMFEGESRHRYRILRSLKNRFGTTHEIGVFEMEEKGLSEVKNPSELFISQRTDGVPGTAIAASMEGTRPILAEVQALVTKTNYTMPQRISSGVDPKRVSILLAILEKRLAFPLWKYDVFISVAGGLKIVEPACDLAIAVAISSGLTDKPAHGSVLVGEIGLSGELRAVPQVDKRIVEAEKLGFTRIIYAKKNENGNSEVQKKYIIDTLPCQTLEEALKLAIE